MMIQPSSSSSSSSRNDDEEETDWSLNRKILGSPEFDLYIDSRFPHTFELFVHFYPSSDKKNFQQSLNLNTIQRSLECPVAECITRISLWFFCQHYILRKYSGSGVLSLKCDRIDYFD